MLAIRCLFSALATLLSLSLLLTGCTLLSPLKKPDIGPTGLPVEAKPNPPFTERFLSPPSQLYDLETTAGVIFAGIIKSNWSQAETGLTTLKGLWSGLKTSLGEKKGVAAATQALDKLTTAIATKKNTVCYESLTQFMTSISDIAKSYKLSPLSDIINVSNAIRTVNFYVESNDWHKAASKMKELENTWGQAKPSMESAGILGKVTTTHSIIKQMKDAIDAENQDAIKEQLANINENMGYIREYYYGK